MIFGSCLAKVLCCFDGILPGTPTEFIAESGAVAGFCMTVFGCGDEEWESAVIIWFPRGEEAGRVAVGKVVLSKWVASVCEALQDLSGFTEEAGSGVGIGDI